MPIDYTVQTCKVCGQAFRKWHECPGPPKKKDEGKKKEG